MSGRPTMSASSRPSTSSSARLKRTGGDFEAALRDPSSTLFLSGGPALSPHSPGSAAGSANGEAGPSRRPSNRFRPYSSRGIDVENGEMDRSFDEDMARLAITPTPRKSISASTSSRSVSYSQAQSRAQWEHEEPLVSPSRTGRLSDASGSTTPTRSSRHRPMRSIGIDAEIAQEASPPSTLSKKRSLFRSPGTASSPDLATLVKRAKDRGPIGSADMRPDDKGRSGSISSNGGLATINERRGSQEKSVSKKARGMLGRMFGARDPSPHAEPDNPIPPIPAAYRQHRVNSRDTDRERDLAGIPEGLSRTTTPPSQAAVPPQIQKPLPSSPSPSPTPASRSRSHHTRQPAYSPSPNVSRDDLTLSRPNTRPGIGDAAGSGSGSALGNRESSGSGPGSGPLQRSPALDMGGFSDDVNGIFAGIGEVSPARELGLAPQSVSLSAATGKGKQHQYQNQYASLSPRYQQAGLGIEAEREKTGQAQAQEKVPGPRTTSLPAGLQVEINGVSGRNLDGNAEGGAGRSKRQEASESDTVRPAVPILGSPLAPSVRLVTTPRLPSADPDRLAVTSDDIARSHFASGDDTPGSGTGDGNGLSQDGVDGDESANEKGRRLACEFLVGNFKNVAEDKVAEFLGGPREVSAAALRYYMQYFGMKGNLVDCFRELCQKLFLRAESQEIDRIIEAFSARFYECNPDTVFGSPGVVHTVTGAMLMLNTDLHIADLTKHMSRSDFIRNAMSAIRESMPDGEDADASSSALVPPSAAALRPPNAQRSASAPIVQPGSASATSASGIPGLPNQVSRVVSEAGAGALAGPGSSSSLETHTYSRAWEQEAETALRDIYNAVRSERILLPINSTNNSNRHSMISLANSLDSRSKLRTPSASAAHKRQSVIGRPGGALNSVYANADNRSPTGSYATSINETLTPFASIGFASNLSHTVIREHEEEIRSTASAVSVSTVDELNDDELALLGAPWAKEGLLSHKLYMEASSKRAKKSEWKQFFTVVQKGELYMFVFGSGSGFSGGSVGGGNWLANAKPVGTIDLIHCLAFALPRNAAGSDRPHCFSLTTATGQVTLFQAGTDDLVLEWVSTCNYWSARQSRQPLAGGVSNMEYGWQRVMPTVTPSNSGGSSGALTVPGSPSPLSRTGSSGEQSQILERKASRTPSIHGIFGNGHAHPNGSGSPSPFRRSSQEHDDRASIRSARSGMSKLGLGKSLGFGTYGRSMGSAMVNPMDKVHINDWAPPIPALVPSTLEEEAQLEALQVYVKQVRADMDAHKALEDGMNRQFTPGSRNALKAKDNWKARANYIHTEIIKYETYIDSLRSAIKERLRQAGEKKLEKSLMKSNASLSLNGNGSGSGSG